VSNQPGDDRLVRCLPKGFGNDIGVEENQRSMPLCGFRPSLMSSSKLMSAPTCAERRA
jgi:hypothetical protein